MGGDPCVRAESIFMGGGEPRAPDGCWRIRNRPRAGARGRLRTATSRASAAPVGPIGSATIPTNGNSPAVSTLRKSQDVVARRRVVGVFFERLVPPGESAERPGA